MTDPDPIAPTASVVAEEPASVRPPRRRLATWLRALLAVAALVALFLVGRRFGGVVASGARHVGELGVWAPLVFIGGYALATVAFLPGSLLTLAGGAIFGLARGVVYVFAGAVIGASLAFFAARTVLRRVVEGKLADNPRFAAIDRAISREGRKIVFLLRLSPVFPFNLLNYALGLTGVRFGDYLIASLGMLPGTLLYVYYGKVIGDVAAVAGGAAVHHDAGYWALLALGLVATIAVTAVVTRTARKALAEEVEDAGF